MNFEFNESVVKDYFITDLSRNIHPGILLIQGC